MAEIIDLFLQQTAQRRLDHLLDTKGLAHFLQPGGGAPALLDDERVREVMVFAIERLEREPVPEAREACYRALRRRLIAQLAAAMVYVGY